MVGKTLESHDNNRQENKLLVGWSHSAKSVCQTWHKVSCYVAGNSLPDHQTHNDTRWGWGQRSTLALLDVKKKGKKYTHVRLLVTTCEYTCNVNPRSSPVNHSNCAIWAVCWHRHHSGKQQKVCCFIKFIIRTSSGVSTSDVKQHE